MQIVFSCFFTHFNIFRIETNTIYNIGVHYIFPNYWKNLYREFIIKAAIPENIADSFRTLKLTEKVIKELHFTLKSGTSDSRKDWFNVGDYKKLPNEVGGKDTTAPEEVPGAVRKLLTEYNRKEVKTLRDIVDFHYRFECIHPFQDGNGRVGRLLLFKECLKYNIVPFVIDEHLKMFYYRGLTEWSREEGFLMDTCLAAQDKFKVWLDYFRIAYE